MLRKLLIAVVLPVAASNLAAAPAGPRAVATAPSCPQLFDRELPGLLGERVPLCRYAGQVVLVVNTASQCGYTPQYEGLEQLYRRYKERGLVVLGFPANDFGGQEPRADKDIASFCQINYGVTFPMFAKSAVIGPRANPLFVDLAAQTGKRPQWNFHKYLVGRDGTVAASFESAVPPGDVRITREIERLLAAR